MTCWLACWMTYWLAVFLPGWIYRWKDMWMNEWMPTCLSAWLTLLLTGELVGLEVYRFVGWLGCKLVHKLEFSGLLTCWLIGCLARWMTVPGMLGGWASSWLVGCFNNSILWGLKAVMIKLCLSPALQTLQTNILFYFYSLGTNLRCFSLLLQYFLLMLFSGEWEEIPTSGVVVVVMILPEKAVILMLLLGWLLGWAVMIV